MKNPLRRLYDLMLKWSLSHRSPWFLGAVAFLESSVFPIPPDVMLLPMTLAKPKKSYFYATICLIMSVIGGLFGYFIGWQLFEIIGQKIIHFYHAEQAFQAFQAKVAQYDVWAVGVAGLTPIPYKIATIGAGALQLNLIRFIIASILARGTRFFAVAFVMKNFGEPAKRFIEKYFEWFTVAFALALVGGYIIIKWMM